MATLYRDTGYTLSHLIDAISVGHIALPDIQPPFVLSAAKARDLLDPMYKRIRISFRPSVRPVGGCDLRDKLEREVRRARSCGRAPVGRRPSSPPARTP
nr:hypothetical protein [Thermoanaerobacterales bacterium]